MNIILIEQRLVQAYGSKKSHYEVLISDDHNEGIIHFNDLNSDKTRIQDFYTNDITLIQDLLKVYFQNGLGQSLCDIFDRLIENELSIRVGDNLYDYEDLEYLINKIEKSVA